MKKSSEILSRIFFATIFFGAIAFSSFGQSDSIRPIHVGLVYPISSNGLSAANYTNRFSLHTIAGISKNEMGAAIAGTANIVKQNASGALIAGAVNIVGNNAKGWQVAGVSNVIKNNANGWQLAGVMNLAGSSHGVQIAGVGNMTAGNAKGLQVAGVINKSRNTNGQIAGVINIAKNVRGIQLAGLINIADSSDYPIGLFNFIKSGEKSISVTIDETMTGMTSFRSGGKVLYGIVGIGYNLKETNRSLYAVEAGMGAHIPILSNLRVNLEAVNLTLSDFKKGTYMKSSLRILPAYRISDRFVVFAGPTINYVNYTKESGKGLVDRYLWSKLRQDDFQGLFLGFSGGIQVML